MTIILALLAGAAAAGWLLPRLLHRATARIDPMIAATAWFLAIAGLLGTLVLVAVLFALPDHGASAGLLALSRDCLISLRHGARPEVEETIGLLGLLALIISAVRVARVARGHIRHSREVVGGHIEAMRLAGQADENDPTLLWVEHPHPLAFSVAGRPGQIVVSRGLTSRLSPAEVDAVLAHERAHLTGRHHLQIAAIDALAVALPFVPLLSQAPRALRQLVELAADRTAAREHGRLVVSSALRNMVDMPVPHTALAMARESVDLRISCLDRPINRQTRVRRYALATLAGTVAGLTPLLSGALAITVLVVLACPLN